MEGLARQTRIQAHVERYLDAGGPLAEFLASVEPDVRDDVARQCRDGQFVAGYFAARGCGPVLARPTRIGGCTLGECIGIGAMGQVYRARQDTLQRDVAVKLLRTEYAQQEDFLARFREEARLLGSIDHPGIVKVLDCDAEGDWVYIVMDLVPGPSLASCLDTITAGSGPRRFDRAARIVAEVLETLAYVHRRGIVHRDIKPSNIVLDGDDRPKLVDFGLARANESPLLTQHGVLVGTPAFLSPELASRQTTDRTAADAWAVGVLLYQLLTGRLPFAGRSADDVLTAVVRGGAPDPRTHVPELPKELAAIVMMALAADPHARYASAAAFGADLRRHLAGEPVVAGRRNLLGRSWRHVHRWRRYYAAAAIIAAACTVTWFVAHDRAAARQLVVAADLFVAGDLPTTGAALAITVREGRKLLAEPKLRREDHDRVARRLDEAENRLRRQHAEGSDLVQRGGGSTVGTTVEQFEAPSAVLQAEGTGRVAEAVTALPYLASVREVLLAAMPRFVIGDPAGRSGVPVRVDELDPRTGRVLSVAARGVTPCALPVPLGKYRVVIGDEHAFGEYSRTVLARGDHVITPTLVPTAQVRATMLPVGAFTTRVGQDSPEAVVYRVQDVEVDGFLIDAVEVTCRQYRAFCRATGHPAPRTWGGWYDDRWDELPVVGVSFLDAAAYAEWCGKRLPTWVEWNLAVRGPHGASLPWGEDRAPLRTLENIGMPRTTFWMDGLRRVGTTLRDRSWCGVFDGCGNASEWTDTPYVAQLGGVPVPFLAWHLVGGGDWRTSNTSDPLYGVQTEPPESQQVGFRCAKSLIP